MKKAVSTLSVAAVLSSTFVIPAYADTYTVKNGDSLYKIANNYSTTVEKLKAANNLSGNSIFVNQLLQIPVAASQQMPKQITVSETKTSTYTVVSGDTLIKIANKHDITLAELMQMNAIKDHLIYPGQSLVVSKVNTEKTIVMPEQTPVPEKPAVTKPGGKQLNSQYTVQKGDSLWKIASKHGTTIQTISTLNSLKTDVITVGQALKIPAASDSIASPNAPQSPVKVSQPSAGSSDKIIQEAYKLIGTPYSWAGSSPAGFDCSGFIYYVYKQAGLSISRISSQTYFDMGKATTNPQPGDLVFFHPNPSNNYLITHMGIYLGNGKFIHASSSKGVEVNSLSATYYQTRLAGFKKL